MKKAKGGALGSRPEAMPKKEVVAMTKKKAVEVKPFDQEAEDKALRAAKKKDMATAQPAKE